MSTTCRLRAYSAWWMRAHFAITMATVASLLALYFGAIQPADTRLHELKTRRADVAREVAANSTRTRQIASVAADVEDLRTQLAKIGTLPKQQELATFINEFAKVGEQTSIRRLAWTPDPNPRRTELFTELPISFSFEGDFFSVFDFLRSTEDMPRLTQVRRLDMKNRPGSAQVDVQLTMNLYFGQE